MKMKQFAPLLFISLTLAAGVLIRWGLVTAFSNPTTPVVIDELTYTLLEGDGVAIVTGMAPGTTIQHLIIPPRVFHNEKMFAVTTIGDGAFANNADLHSVMLPPTLKAVGNCAFKNCSELTVLCFDERSAVEGIGPEAFSGCAQLEQVDLPDSIRYMGGGAFAKCQSLGSVNIPTGVDVIEDCTFAGCESLTVIQIPPSITHIEDNAFRRCSSLEMVSIHDESKLRVIGPNAFANCSSLAAFIFPQSIRIIGAEAFKNCSSLDILTFRGKNAVLKNNIFDWAVPGRTGGANFIPSDALEIVMFAGNREEWDAMTQNGNPNLTLSPQNAKLNVICLTN